MSKKRVASEAVKERVNISELINFKVVLQEDSKFTYLPCKDFDDAQRLFRSLLLSEKHNLTIYIQAQQKLRMVGRSGAMMVSLPLPIIKAAIMWNGEGMNGPNYTENHVWTLLGDRIDYSNLWLNHIHI